MVLHKACNLAMGFGSCLSYEPPTEFFDWMLALELCPPKHGAGHSWQSPELTLNWKVVPVWTFQFTILPPSSWDCLIFSQLQAQQSISFVPWAPHLTWAALARISAQEKINQSTWLALEQRWEVVSCMITGIKAAQKAVIDKRGAGVRLWSLWIMYLCPRWQWQPRLGEQEDKCCLRTASCLQSKLCEVAVVRRWYCYLQGTSVVGLQGVRLWHFLPGQSVPAVPLRA